MSNLSLQVCPVCGVKIESGEKVLFSYGPPGTRSRLWARVCNYVQKPGCINQDEEARVLVQETDYYKPI
jgi:hypothetical protein